MLDKLNKNDYSLFIRNEVYYRTVFTQAVCSFLFLFSQNHTNTISHPHHILPTFLLKKYCIVNTSNKQIVKQLEEYGIGRPSTYAPIITKIQQRNYVEKI